MGNNKELDYGQTMDKKLSKLESLIESFNMKGSICHIKGIIDISNEIFELKKDFNIIALSDKQEEKLKKLKSDYQMSKEVFEEYCECKQTPIR